MSGKEISGAARRDLRTLGKDNAEGVANHLVMIERLLETEPERARLHADHIVSRAGRVAVVREARGLVAYRQGDWKVALNEFRTARRLSGSHHLLPYLVDIERALGRPERALELSASPESLTLDAASRIELDIVISGVRRDMGDLDAALLQLRGPELDAAKRKPWSARLFYAYADTLLAKGLEEEARTWFAAATEADPELETDAAERLDEMDGTVYLDLGEDDEDEASERAEATEGDPVQRSESAKDGESERAEATEGDPAQRSESAEDATAQAADLHIAHPSTPVDSVDVSEPAAAPQAGETIEETAGAPAVREPASNSEPDSEPESESDAEAGAESQTGAASETEPESNTASASETGERP